MALAKSSKPSHTAVSYAIEVIRTYARHLGNAVFCCVTRKCYLPLPLRDPYAIALPPNAQTEHCQATRLTCYVEARGSSQAAGLITGHQSILASYHAFEEKGPVKRRNATKSRAMVDHGDGARDVTG